ncbi:unnamed protein product [Paramecium sonneborni]|uniref:Diacylglycerol kinase n=1 Tax=Paramecium sonneborni TaxID=65129 RepID=A0A8S1KI74_9CILI|nr:unnamed protein product [Paramecium sonneborni]
MIYIIISLIVIFAIAFFFNTQPIKQKIKKKITKEKSEGKENESLEHAYIESKSSGLLFCNVCKKLLFSLWGAQYHECLICGIYVHKKCRKNQIQCKIIKQLDKELTHQWLSGNLPVNSICCHCGLTCGYFFDLEGKSCLWCQKVVHEECKDKVNQQCDFGEFKDAIILPNGNYVKPIIVVINQKSGGQVGVDFYKSFLRFLNPIQVLNIQEMDKLKNFAHIKTARLITAGGDGTVASVINYIKEFDWNPPIAILPLGTGNDLSRALGWGGTYEQLDASHVLSKVMNNENITLLDRWNVKIGNKNYKLFNYFGIGLDAKFCYDFHNLRQTSPQLFKSRLGNKLIYTHMGLNDLIKNEKSGLGKRIKVTCDDVIVDIPDQVENVIILNINSWSGGVTGLWEQDADFKQQKINDGLLEIIGVTSILHLGRIQVGLDKPYKLGQGRKISITYPSNSYVQIDGEPLSIGPSIIEISLVDKVQVLTNYELTWENRFLKTMEWAEEQKHITKYAKNEIVNRMLHYYQ